MYYFGDFLNLRGETVTVRIVTGADRATSMEIGGAGSSLCFAEDPVEISSSVNGSGDHILRSEASVRLLVRDFMPDFFRRSCREAVVNILKGGVCVFAGYIEPQAYSQGYNEAWDELTLSCIDALSALQYSRYRNAGEGGMSYSDLRKSATLRSMESLVCSILSGTGQNLNIGGTSLPKIWEDGSRKMTDGSTPALRGTMVNELLFLGDDEDAVWTQQEVLEEILRYLNLRVAMDGLDFRIFGWDTLMGEDAFTWKEVKDGPGAATQAGSRKNVTFSMLNATDCDTQISVGETFNRILLTCDTESMEMIVESPLEESAMTSPYTGRQLYMRDYCAESKDGESVSWSELKGAFRAMLTGQRTEYERAWTRDWLIRVMDHPSWQFRIGGIPAIGEYCSGNTNQQALPNALASRLGAALVSWGSVKEMACRKDDSIPGKVDMKTSLVISVNGNNDQNPATASPTPVSLRNMAPVAVYTGPAGGSVYSPSDDETTNYIVISGKLTLNPLPKTSSEDPVALAQMQNRGEDGVHLYCQRFYKAASPNVHASLDTGIAMGLQPFTEMDPATVEYTRSSGGSTADTVGKVGVVRCMLVIGDKCCVETGTDGMISDFEWKPFKTRTQCSTDDEYYAQSFTIGFNPAVGDKLIGTEFDIRNNIAYYTGIDAEGTAIPVRKSDALSGPVRFEILGPDYICWNEVGCTVEKWSGAVTGWPETKKLLLPLLANILLTGFEIKIFSDNSGEDPLDGSDLVYMSDTEESFVNVKDDVSFRIVSALTASERRELGVRDTLMLSTPCDAATGLGVTALRFGGTDVKPERAYVDALYRELREPRVEMEQSVADTPDNVGLLHRYVHPAMPGKTFFALGISRNLREGSARLKLMETWI